jgi:hypothetical protein
VEFLQCCLAIRVPVAESDLKQGVTEDFRNQEESGTLKTHQHGAANGDAGAQWCAL